MNNVLIYPKFKKTDLKEIVSDADMDSVANHYTVQFMKAMENHGINADPAFYKDLTFLREMVKAILLRTQGKHHSIQDFMDDAYIDEMPFDEDADYNEEDEH
jgi:hypothetical protein